MSMGISSLGRLLYPYSNNLWDTAFPNPAVGCDAPCNTKYCTGTCVQRRYMSHACLLICSCSWEVWIYDYGLVQKGCQVGFVLMLMIFQPKTLSVIVHTHTVSNRVFVFDILGSLTHPLGNTWVITGQPWSDVDRGARRARAETHPITALSITNFT